MPYIGLLTGGGPSGAVRRVAGHNTAEVAVLCLSVTCRSTQRPPLGPNKKTKPTLNSQLRSYVNRGQGLSLSKCFVYLVCIVRATLLEATGQPTSRLTIPSVSQPFSPTGPTSCSCQSQIIWHDIMQAPISNNQKHPIADPRYTPFPTYPLLRSRFGAITAWLSYNTGWDNLTSEQSGVLSLIAAVGWNTRLSFKHMCLLFTDRFSTAARSRGLETPAPSCQD